MVDRALERDHAAASAEYLAQFRSDIEGFVGLRGRAGLRRWPRRNGPAGQNRYYAFTDPAGGSGADSFTLAICHKEGDHIVIDAVHERRPPFNPETVVDDFCIILKNYRITRVTGDRYAGEWPREQFRKRGMPLRLHREIQIRSLSRPASNPEFRPHRPAKVRAPGQPAVWAGAPHCAQWQGFNRPGPGRA